MSLANLSFSPSDLLSGQQEQGREQLQHTTHHSRHLLGHFLTRCKLSHKPEG